MAESTRPQETILVVPAPTPLLRVLRALRTFAARKPLAAFGAVVVLVLIVVGAAPSVFATHPYEEIDIASRLEGPSAEHYFGTDRTGRDVFSRIVYGAQTSVLIGFGAVTVAGVLATVIGMISAFYRGWVDMLMQRLIDVWMAFPGLIFIIFVVSIFGNSRGWLILVLGVLLAAGTSRIVRGAGISIVQYPYMEAARAIGASDLRIIGRHMLPNLLSVIIVNASVQIGAVILIESALAFLGFGTPPPFPSWGRMLQEAQTLMLQHPYLALFPGAALTLTVYAFNMFGDGLRDVLDPRLRGST